MSALHRYHRTIVPLCAVATLSVAACVNSSNYGSADLGGSQFYVSKTTLVADGNDVATVGLALSDAEANPISGVTVTFSAPDCNIVQPAHATDAHGLAIGRITSREPGQRTITATISRGDLSTVLPRNVALDFTSASIADGAAPGSAFDFILVVVDAMGVPAPDYVGTVAFKSSDARAVLPSNYTVTAAQRGEIVFPGGVRLFTAGVQVVQAVDVATDRVVAQQSYVVKPGPAAALAVTGIPAQLTVGSTTQARAVLYDAYQNVAAFYTGTLVMQSSDGNATYPASHTYTAADGGGYTFAPIVFETPGTQTLRIADPAASALSWTDAAVSVVGSAPQRIALTLGAAVQAGVPGPLNLAVVDEYGNSGADFTGTIAITASDANASYPTQVTFVAGEASQTDLAVPLVWRTVGVQSITADATSGARLLGADVAVTVTPGPLASFKVAGPTSIVAGRYANLQVSARDTFDNIDTSYAGTARFSTTAALAVMEPSRAFSAADLGSYAFAVILSTSGNQVFSVADSTQPGLSGNITIAVQPDALTAMRVSTTPAAVTAGGNITLTLQAVDQFGNLETGFTGTVDIAVSDGAATALASYMFNTNDQGSHVFTHLVLRTAGNQNITATVRGSAPVIAGQSNNTVVTAANPVALSFVQSPGAAQVACTVFDQAATVAAVDSYGNRANAPDGVTVSLQGGITEAPLAGTTVASYGPPGLASFGNLAVSIPGGTYHLVATNTDANHPLTPAVGPMFSVATAPVQITVGAPLQAGSCVDVPYTITSACPVDLSFALDANNAGVFAPMHMAGNANRPGIAKLEQGSGAFSWDSTRDLPHQSRAHATVQVHASNGLQDVNATVTNVPVNNALAFSTGSAQGDSAASCVAVADMDRDSADDVIACQGSAISVRLNGRPAGTLQAAVQYTLPFTPTVITVADINRDGKRDVFAADATGHAALLPGTGAGALGPAQNVGIDMGAVTATFADMNRDGVLDLVMALGAPTQQVQVTLQSPNGTFNAPIATAVSNPGALAVADIFRDGTLKIVVAAASGVTILDGMNATLLVTLTGSAAGAVAATDVNHDGAVDVVAIMDSQAISVWLNQSGYGAAAVTALGAPLGALRTGDFDNDGNIDLMGTASGALMGLAGNGLGGFAPSTFGLLGSQSADAWASGDLDQDGYLDCVTVDPVNGTAVYENRTAHPCGWGLQAPKAAPVTFAITRGAAADFNEDGKPDLLVVSNSARSAKVLRNDGTGTYVASSGAFTGADPRTPDVADFNGDGLIDAVIPNAQDGTLDLLTGDGTGSFAAATVSTGVPANPVAVAHGVFYGDGKTSLAVAGGTDHGVRVLRNRGDATFAPGPFLATAAAVVGLATSDVDNDGSSDIVAVTGGTLVVFAGHSDGTFSGASPIGTACSPTDSPVVRDADGDGRPDVAMLCNDNTLRLWLGNGSGGFNQAAQVSPAHVAGLSAADFDGDGHLDFITGGDGRFNIALYDGMTTFSVMEYATLESGAGALAADVDADGLPDVVTLHPSFAVTSLSRGNGVFTSPRTARTCDGQLAPAFDDIDQDGWTDVLYSGCGANLFISRGAPDANFLPEQRFDAPIASRTVITTDLNHDGRPDAVVAVAREGNVTTPLTTVYMNTGDANLLTPGAGINVSGIDGVDTLAAGDINGDGNVDLVLGSFPDRDVFSALGDGNGNFYAENFIGGAINFSAGRLILHDVNQDGNVDLVVNGPDLPGQTHTFLSNGDPDFPLGTNRSADFTSTYNAANEHAAHTDFNHDGSIDMIAPPNSCTAGACGFLALAMGLPSGRFTTGTGFATALQPGDVAVADINHDGNMDVLAIFYNSAAIGIFLGDGRGNFAPGRYFVGDGPPGRMGVRDLDYDGHPDVIVSTSNTSYSGSGLTVRRGR